MTVCLHQGWASAMSGSRKEKLVPGSRPLRIFDEYFGQQAWINDQLSPLQSGQVQWIRIWKPGVVVEERECKGWRVFAVGRIVHLAGGLDVVC